jgi:hypothetical protein
VDSLTITTVMECNYANVESVFFCCDKRRARQLFACLAMLTLLTCFPTWFAHRRLVSVCSLVPLLLPLSSAPFVDFVSTRG